jgi:23S rRNA-/tRNA-specific pseudouridylate synthase
MLESPICLNVLDKSTCGLIIAAKSVAGKSLRLDEVVLTYRCVVHGKAGADEGLDVGDEYAIDFPIQGKTKNNYIRINRCSKNCCVIIGEDACTKFRIISFTQTRNSPDGYLTTLEGVPVQGVHNKQILIHLFGSHNPVIGTNRFTKPVMNI